MNALVRGLAIVAAVCTLAGCGSHGSSANPPSDLTATPGDGRVTLTWTMAPNVQYWVYYAPASSISVDNWTTTAGSLSMQDVVSPLVIGTSTNGSPYLTNGTTYAFTMDGRTNNGPGGNGSPSITAVPRLAGATWTAGAPLGAADLDSIAYGTYNSNPLFVTVGSGGTIATSADGITWTSVNDTLTTADLDAVAFGGSSFVAAGAGGTLLYSNDGVTWSTRTSPTANAIYGMAGNGSDGYVGVGANGTIIYSSGGTNWQLANSGTSNDLLAVGYGNGEYVAVGKAGTLLISTDGVNWTAEPSHTPLDLKGVTYGSYDTTTNNSTTTTNLFVAVGAFGTVLTSLDGVTWTSQTPPTSNNFNAVAYGAQLLAVGGTEFVAVGDSGAIYTSIDGTSWTHQTSGTTQTLKGVAHSGYSASYSAVGVAGTNLSSQ